MTSDIEASMNCTLTRSFSADIKLISSGKSLMSRSQSMSTHALDPWVGPLVSFW